MFDGLIEKAEALVVKIMTKVMARSRVQARFQVAGAIYAAKTREDMGLSLEQMNLCMTLSIALARKLEEAVEKDAQLDLNDAGL